MSTVESIGLHLSPAHLRKLGKGMNIQLSHAQLHHALNHDATAELEMAKKHCTALLRAHRQGKGYRIMHEKLSGGKITLKSVGRTISKTAKNVIKIPVVKKVAKELGHLAVGVAENYAAQNGMDASAYGNLAHKAIEYKNIKRELQEQIGDDIMRYANEQVGSHMGGKIKVSKGLRDFGNGLAKGLKTVASNPIAQGVATNLLTAAVMGAGVRKRVAKDNKMVKGSAQAKEHMAMLRSMRSGGALMPAVAGAVKRRPLRFE